MKSKLLTSGLGGGLDIVNASLLYFAVINEGSDAILGSSRPAPLDRIKNHRPFADSGTMLNRESSIDYGLGSTGRSRYCEPKIASLLGTKVLFFSRKYHDETDISRLRQAVRQAQKQFSFSNMFFVDAGGDSMTFTLEDATGTTENLTDPFAGGDSQSLEALANLNDVYLAVVSVGLDVSEKGFHKNIELLTDKGAYFGRVNLATGEKQDYKLNHLIEFKQGFLKPYFDLAENILVLTKEDQTNPNKIKSHTAVVTYHALKGNYGIQRTFVPWEPKTNGKKGVLVKPEHCWMYFFDAGKIHPLKVELNKSLV